MSPDLRRAATELADAFADMEHAEIAAWTSRGHRDAALVRFVLQRLADPASGHGKTLAALRQRRRFRAVVPS